MRIGIDARFLTHPQPGGFKAYTRNLIAALAGSDSTNEYVLYTDRISREPVDLPSNFAVRPVKTSNFATREQCALPMAMRRDGVDIAHSPCNTAPVFHRGPLVVTIHDVIALEPDKAMKCGPKQRILQNYWRTVIPWSAKRATVVLTDSDAAARRIYARLRLPAGRMRTAPLAIDPVFSTHPLLKVPPEGLTAGDQFIMGFAAADRRKNSEGLIGAYHIIASRFPRLRLVLVCANAGVRNDLRSARHDGVCAIGPVSQQDLMWLYRNAYVFIFPSFDEGFGLPPLEAMASGTPVVSSDRGSLPEVLGDAALYVDPNSVESIADGITSVLADESIRAEMVRNGTARACLYTLGRMADHVLRAYSDAIPASMGRRLRSESCS